MTTSYDVDPELIPPAAGLERFVFWWSRNHGDCYDCGRPAAFLACRQPMCSVCAANHAADGETVERIEEEEP